MSWQGGASDDDSGEKPEISKKLVGSECSDIVVHPDAGVVLEVKRAAPVDEFTGRDSLEPGSMQAKGPSASCG